jgi:glutamine synthetase
VLTGRTLYGAAPSKGQELEDQYFGSIRERILAFMMDFDRELWRMGIPAKTRHNEVAPAQFELAPVYEATTVGSDHNMLVMSTMKKVAMQHGLVALLHEKPFKGVNGSGKHNNWSLATDDGENLLEPGHDPHANAQFLTFLAAVTRGVNQNADLLRAAIADAGNDHRLGANEAPPAIVSIFLGAQLEDICKQLEAGAASSSKKGGSLELGVTSLPDLPKDATDRNRTSPFAFTGNKFEFRAVGSSAPIYWPQTVLNTIVADSLEFIADKMEKLKPDDFAGLTKILSEVIKENKQVYFSGNGYSEEWHAEAARRGLPNNKSTVDSLPALESAKAKKVFSKFGVLSERELSSRADIFWERYVKVQNIEANVALEIAKTQIVPAAVGYLGQLALASKSKGAAKVADQVAALTDALVERIEALEKAQHDAHHAGSVHAEAKAFKEQVLPAQDALRAVADELETVVADDLWPLPKYRELLFQY